MQCYCFYQWFCSSGKNSSIEPCHEILALFVLAHAGCLIFGRTLRLFPYFMCVNSEGSGETARMRRIAWDVAGRLCDKYYDLMSWLNYVLVGVFSGLLFLTLKLKTSLVDLPWSFVNEPPQDKTNKTACAPSEDSDQPGHPPSLIRVFAFRMKKAWVLSYPLSAQRRLWSDSADAQADLSLRWAHSHFVGFVMRRLNCETIYPENANIICGFKPIYTRGTKNNRKNEETKSILKHYLYT